LSIDCGDYLLHFTLLLSAASIIAISSGKDLI